MKYKYYVSTWMDIENMLNEGRHLQKTIYYMYDSIHVKAQIFLMMKMFKIDNGDWCTYL
jgi:hypothetical protein